LRVDFGHASEHKMAQLAKAVIGAFYGSPPHYSYFDGCSDGGHEALAEAQRYPRDFDGILAGAPANNWTDLLGMWEPWLIASNTDPDGQQILTSEKLPALHQAVMDRCADANGLIEDPRSCDFNPATLRCADGADNATCLTPAEVRVVRKLYLGPHDARGHYFYPGGEPYGSELAWNGWLIDSQSDRFWPRDDAAYLFGPLYLRDLAYWHNPPLTFRLQDSQFTMREYRRLQHLKGIYSSTDPDLSAFEKAGGKIIMWQGWADQAIAPTGLVEYYKAVTRRAGGFDASQRFSRVYMIPDQYHCLGGGDPQVTANLLSPLIGWVEEGTAPGTISFPLLHPTPQLSQVTVQPFNALAPPASGTRGLNTRYQGHYVGRFSSGCEKWCHVEGTKLICTRHRPHISYRAGGNHRITG
jgi:tannase/feruloyl esterase